MKHKHVILTTLLFLFSQTACNQKIKVMEYNPLTPEEEAVIIGKSTEMPFTGEYLNKKEKGTYICKRCNSPLYRSEDKFESHCGWPSFDDEIKGAVRHQLDADGRRTEILCAHCGAHLGHVFVGEGFTNKNIRHCVNSISMKFLPTKDNVIKKVYFASGCFWGTEYHFMKAKGVTSTSVGYMGGHTLSPTYKEVCTGKTGHVETVEILFDSTKTAYEELVKLFFETHDFTQVGGQGPDVGDQYQSVIFYSNQGEKDIALKIIEILEKKGFKVATNLRPVSHFWKAEEYHQSYYEKKGGKPYCHIYRPIF